MIAPPATIPIDGYAEKASVYWHDLWREPEICAQSVDGLTVLRFMDGTHYEVEDWPEFKLLLTLGDKP